MMLSDPTFLSVLASLPLGGIDLSLAVLPVPGKERGQCQANTQTSLL